MSATIKTFTASDLFFRRLDDKLAAAEAANGGKRLTTEDYDALYDALAETVSEEQDEAGYDPFKGNTEALDRHNRTVEEPEETWADFLACEGYKALTACVRLRREQRRACRRDSAEYRRHGADLYDLQVALKARFRIDIAKVK